MLREPNEVEELRELATLQALLLEQYLASPVADVALPSHEVASLVDQPASSVLLLPRHGAIKLGEASHNFLDRESLPRVAVQGR